VSDSKKKPSEELDFKDRATFEQWLEFFKLAFASICTDSGTLAAMRPILPTPQLRPQ
jgi:hypothetical protein